MSCKKMSVPQTVATDPVCIPLVGCTPAINLQFDVQEKSAHESFVGDMMLFCVHCQPEKNLGETAPAAGETRGVCPASAKTKVITLCDEAKNFDDKICEGALQDVINCIEFKAKLGRSATSRVYSKKVPVKIVGALGVGATGEVKTQNCVKIACEIANLIKSHRPTSVAIVLSDAINLQQQPPAGGESDDRRNLRSHFTPRQVQCILETMILEMTPDNRFKSSEELRAKPAPLEKIVLYTNDVTAMSNAVCTAKITSQGIFFAMELVNAPANYCNTCSLANAAVEMASTCGLSAKVLEQPEIEELKMGCYLAVAKGSIYPPKFIHLTYKGEGSVNSKIAFVGKGLCFDSGGYNIKSKASSIELMKFDMGGAAAVLGAAFCISRMKPKNVEVHFIVAAAENMVSSLAYRPGDILTASNGKTVEIGNTDAEGRLTLADALVYAEKLGADTIVDVATLTGACVVALGDKYAGLFSSSEPLAQDILSCADTSGEAMWQMPLVSDYRELFDSKIADMNNVGGGGKAGAIVASVFLKEFVEKASWAHIDIAGPAWNSKDHKATGFAVRTLTEYILKKSLS